MKASNRMPEYIIGWDVGGAHVKAAVIDPNGKVVNVFQVPCPLWKGIDYLNKAISRVLSIAPVKKYRHSITMTGELVDLFDNRDQGVMQIIKAMRNNLIGDELEIYAGIDGFIKLENVQRNHYAVIASANWLAAASLVATKLGEGLFVDIGSTTTDILLLADKKVQAIGLTDYQRMISEELVYTGIIRTAVMAVAQSTYFNGHYMGLMAEYFATMADVYRLTGELNEMHDLTDTADGAEKTVLASAKRLSRMTGYDYSENDLSLWQQFAQNIKSQQKNKIKNACKKHLSRNLLPRNSYFIGAGVGRFLVEQIAAELGYAYFDFSQLCEQKLNTESVDTADCAPAVSVALLANAIKI